MSINNQAGADSRHVRDGKDGALYNAKGVLLATMENFVASVNFENSNYSVLGNAQKLEINNSYSVTLSMTQIVIKDDEMFIELMEGLETSVMPIWNFQGVLVGRNGSEQRVIYRDCVLSGQVDIQSIKVGEQVKRNWNFFVNSPPALQSMLDI